MSIWGDNAKDVEGFWAVVTEQGTSANHVTGVKVVDATARLPGCAGENIDAISAYTQAPLIGPPTYVTLPASQWHLIPKYESYSKDDPPSRPAPCCLVWSRSSRPQLGAILHANFEGPGMGKDHRLGGTVETSST